MMTCGNRGRGVGTAILAAILWITGTALAADQPEHGAGVLGAETLIYGEISRPGDLIDRVTGDRVREFLTSVPGYSEALNGPDIKQFRQVVEFIAGQLDTTWEEGLRKLTGGGIVVGVEEADPPRLVIVITPTDPAFLERSHAKLIELAREDAERKGKPDPVTQAEYRGLTGFSFSDKEAHTILDGRLVIASGSDALKAVIDRTLDGGTRLTETDTFQQRQPEQSHTAWAYARLDRLRELDPDRFGGDDPDPGALFLVGAWVELLRKAPWASATLDWTEDQLTASLTLPAPPDGLSEPMSRFFPPENEGAPRPIEVEGTIASINLWRDQMALWEVREELLPPEALQGLAQLDTIAGQFFGGRDFGDSVLEPLGTHWQLVAATQNHEAMSPQPALKLPAFALVLELDPDQPEFSQRLRVALQSIVGLTNLGASETGAPPLMLGSETYEGVTISKATFMPAPEVEPDADASNGATPSGEGDPQEVHYRHNYSPSVAEVEGRFIVSSSVGLTHKLIDALKAHAEIEPTDATLLIEADGPALADLAERNRERIVLQNMLERGNDRQAAERDVAALIGLLRYLGHGELRLIDGQDASTLTFDFTLGK